MSDRKILLKLLSFAIFLTMLAACVASPTAVPTAQQTAIISPPTAVALSPSPIATNTSILTTPIAAAETPWWNDAVFYEVFVRSFYDTNGDGIGDLNGVIAKLDYLQSLGVNALWLMPINPSRSYHGYDVTDYLDVNPQYGTKADFIHLMDEAHKRGMKIIIDLVLNHTSSQNPWFIKSVQGDPTYKDYYVWSDKDPGYRGTNNQVVWFKADNNKYYYANFGSNMPDLNLMNPAVIQEIHNIVQFWLTNMHVDGFRLDAVRNYVESGTAQADTPQTHAWLKDFYQFYKGINPNAFTVAEVWASTAQVVPYVGNQVDTTFEFDLARAFINTAIGPLPDQLSDQMNLVLQSYPKGQYSVFLTNHDQDRVISDVKTVERAKLAATLMLTSPGVPFIYYGEEIGMTGYGKDEDKRRPMQWANDSSNLGFTTGLPWEAPSLDYKLASVTSEDKDPGSLLNVYRALIKLRNEYPALRTGDTIVISDPSLHLYGMLRYDKDTAFLILANVHIFDATSDVYSLNLPTGPFSGPVQATSEFGLLNPAAPQINDKGGFSNYKPFATIPSGAVAIIKLTH